jgi:hypothetical protein
MTSNLLIRFTLGLLLATVILSCQHRVLPPRSANFVPASYLDTLAWIKEGRTMNISRLTYNEEGKIEEVGEHSGLIVYDYDSLLDTTTGLAFKKQFLERMRNARVQNILFSDDYIEVHTSIADSSYRELKTASGGFYHKENRNLEDVDPQSELFYCFLVLEMEMPRRRNEIINYQRLYKTHTLIQDSVIWYRSWM